MTGSHISARRRATAIAAATVIVLGVSTSTAAASSTAKHHGHTAIQHIVLVQTDPGAAAPTVVAYGPIHARGTDTVIDPNHDVFTFPAGSINVTHIAKQHHDSYDPVTCYGHFTERGKFRVTGGTGAYAHARGHGTYSVEGNVIGCDQNKPPETYSVVIKASGPLHL